MWLTIAGPSGVFTGGPTLLCGSMVLMDNKFLEPVVGIYKKYYGATAPVIIEVGSRDGDNAEYLRTKLKAKKAFAIEANPALVSGIAEAHPKLTVRETAISNFDGEAEFLQVNSDDVNLLGTSSLDTSKASREEMYKDVKTKIITVPVQTLATFLEKEKLSKSVVDVVKIDIEGMTYQALVGMGDYITSVKMFHLETERKYPHPSHKNNIEVAGYMRSRGFFLAGVFYEWGPNVQDQIWMNKALLPEGSGPLPREISER